ncbi:MAG: hypothetical protein EP330_12865 [Deltaproteobacteria bacterium]|nr:MAG: hypothetical protein EP330_12865 [Deltaproteobacteria bacterium]
MARLLPALLLLTACNPPLRFEEVWNEEDGALVSIWGPSPDEVWTVGGQIEQGAAWRGSGEDWEAIEVPQGVGLLNWVHGTGPDDLWLGGIQGALLHWDGSALTDESLDVPEAIWGLYADASDEVYAVGGTSAWGGEGARAWRRDATGWSEISLSSPASDASSLFKTTRIGDDIWLIGGAGVALAGRGDSFTSVPSGTAEDLVTVTAFDGGALIVGGRITGTAWTATTEGFTEVARTPAGLFGVTDLFDGSALVSGVRGYAARIHDVGGDNELEQLDTPNELLLHAVYAFPDDLTYAVGGNLDSSSGPYRGTLLMARTP